MGQDSVSTPVIILSDDERQELREAWKKTKDFLSLVALQNDDELRKLCNVSKEVRAIQRMKEEERAKEVRKFDLKAWLQKCLAYALGLLKAE